MSENERYSPPLEQKKLVIDSVFFERLQSGDKKAQKEFIENYRYIFLSLLRKNFYGPFVQSKENVEDILQNAFLKIFKGITSFSFDVEEKFIAWAINVFMNSTRRFLRDNKKFFRESSLDQGDVAISVDINFAKKDNSQNKILDRLEILEIVALLDENSDFLTERENQVFKCFIYEGKTIEEIASEFNLSISGVRKIILRVRDKMREHFPGHTKIQTGNYEDLKKFGGLLEKDSNILTQKQKDIFKSVVFDGLRYAEVAERMGVTVGTIAKVMSIIRKKLNK